MNKKVITEQLLQAIWASENALSLKDDEFLTQNEARLKDNLAQVTNAFSGSWIGYHANVYYRDLQTPPPGDHFSSEWGLMSAYMSNPTSRNWGECSREGIRAAIMTDVHPEYENRMSEVSTQAKQVLDENCETVQTIVDALLAEGETPTLQRIHDDLAKIDLKLTAHKVIDVLRPHGQLMSRDSTAMSQGIITPVHCIVQAEQIALLHPFNGLETLAGCARRVLKYMEINDLIERSVMSNGNKVFIGHGRSPLWRELKDFVQDRLHLEWEEFNREPTAGIATVERLQHMLDAASFAFLVMTAEDHNRHDHARAGECGSRGGAVPRALEFPKAIVVLEEGCSEFSNITGLSQIRFPAGNISACFEEIRRVLEREGIV
jgi:hypothetical protein